MLNPTQLGPVLLGNVPDISQRKYSEITPLRNRNNRKLPNYTDPNLFPFSRETSSSEEDLGMGLNTPKLAPDSGLPDTSEKDPPKGRTAFTHRSENSCSTSQTLFKSAHPGAESPTFHSVIDIVQLEGSQIPLEEEIPANTKQRGILRNLFDLIASMCGGRPSAEKLSKLEQKVEQPKVVLNEKSRLENDQGFQDLEAVSSEFNINTYLKTKLLKDYNSLKGSKIKELSPEKAKFKNAMDALNSKLQSQKPPTNIQDADGSTYLDAICDMGGPNLDVFLIYIAKQNMAETLANSAQVSTLQAELKTAQTELAALRGELGQEKAEKTVLTEQVSTLQTKADILLGELLAKKANGVALEDTIAKIDELDKQGPALGTELDAGGEPLEEKACEKAIVPIKPLINASSSMLAEGPPGILDFSQQPTGLALSISEQTFGSGGLTIVDIDWNTSILE